MRHRAESMLSISLGSHKMCEDYLKETVDAHLIERPARTDWCHLIPAHNEATITENVTVLCDPVLLPLFFLSLRSVTADLDLRQG